MKVTTLDKLKRLAKKHGISKTGVLLGEYRNKPYTYSYVHQAINENIKIGKPFKKAIKLLYATHEPPKPRIGVFIDLPTIEDKEKVLKLSMKERAERLLED